MIKILMKAKIPWKQIEKNETIELPKDTSVADILQQLEISPGDESNFLIAVNGKIENKSYILQDGDRLSILPALIGG